MTFFAYVKMFYSIGQKKTESFNAFQQISEVKLCYYIT